MTALYEKHLLHHQPLRHSFLVDSDQTPEKYPAVREAAQAQTLSYSQQQLSLTRIQQPVQSFSRTLNRLEVLSPLYFDGKAPVPRYAVLLPVFSFPIAVKEPVNAILRQRSFSKAQRRMKIGYARAGRIMDLMEERGIVGPYAGSKPRELIVDAEEYLRELDE